jgi:hypothetical protein
MMRGFWRWIFRPKPNFDLFMRPIVGFWVGMYAQAGRLDTSTFGDTGALIAAICLALATVLGLLTFLLAALLKFLQWRRRRVERPRGLR